MRTSKPDGHVLGGDAPRPPPAVFRGQHTNLLGLLADVETGQEFASVAAKKKASTLSKQTFLGTNNSAKYKLEMAPKGQHGAEAVACAS